MSYQVGCPGTRTELADSVQGCLQLSQQQVCGDPPLCRHKTGATVRMLHLAGHKVPVGLLHISEADKVGRDKHSKYSRQPWDWTCRNPEEGGTMWFDSSKAIPAAGQAQTALQLPTSREAASI